jgi:hypothetical protein
MAARMKREGKKRNDADKDYSGHPQATHTHDHHDVIHEKLTTTSRLYSGEHPTGRLVFKMQ